MTTLRWSTLVGLVIGVVWAFDGIGGAFVTAILGGIGGLVGYALSHGTIDLGVILGRRDD
jgi:hypothetical protein